jgi:hypothetical protein
VIIVGEMSGLGETVNMARNVNDISQPDPNILVVGQIYHIAVQRYLKGSGVATIDIVQPEAYLFESTPKTQENIGKAKAKDNHIPLRVGIKYLFFLNAMQQEFPGKNYFAGDLHPWRFILPDKGNAEPESPWSEATRVFRSRPSADLINEVELWVNGGKYPTPTKFPTIPAPITMPTLRPYP